MWSLAWHPNGTDLAAGVNLNGKTGVRLFDFTTDRSTWIETSGNVLALSWSPDGTMLAACISSSPDTAYLVWDATTLAQVLAVEQETDPALC
jgi:WD40 repeat protein